MSWYQVEISVKPGEFEFLEAVLSSAGAEGIFRPMDNRIIGYFESNSKEIILFQLDEYLSVVNVSAEDLTITEIADEAWHLKWKDNFKPIKLTERISIYPDWMTDEINAEIPLIIRPGMAFGTGTHETTQMALQLLEKYMPQHAEILDAGCGTGILTIAALKMGASSVDCYDIDSDIVDNFNENMELNGIADRFRLIVGDATQLDEYPWSFIISNIQKTPNLQLLESIFMAKCPAPVIFTGILDVEKEAFSKALESKGRKVVDILESGEWVAFYAE